jgi:hypothetical protein
MAANVYRHADKGWPQRLADDSVATIQIRTVVYIQTRSKVRIRYNQNQQ